MSNIILSFFISLFIGLMIGLEREHSHVEKIQPIGVRSFTLIALIGTYAAIMHEMILGIILSVFVFSIIIFSYFRSTKKLRNKIDFGITTEISAAIVYCLGYMVPSYPLTAIVISAMVLLILIERQYLHVLARKKFKPHEIETALMLIIFILGILPVLPNKTIDQWQLFNPKDFGILIVTIASIQFAGYIAIRLLGERFGIAITGFLGGLVSSTSIFLMLPTLLRQHPKFYLATMASAILATISMLISMILIAFVASTALFSAIFLPFFVMIVMGFIVSLILLHFQQVKKHSLPILSNPLNLPLIFRTAIFIAMTLIFIALAKRIFGIDGILFVSFLGGLFEIQGVTLAIALLFLGNELNTHEVIMTLCASIIAGFLSKLILLWILTSIRFAAQTTLFLLATLIGGVLTYKFIIPPF